MSVSSGDLMIIVICVLGGLFGLTAMARERIGGFLIALVCAIMLFAQFDAMSNRKPAQQPPVRWEAPQAEPNAAAFGEGRNAERSSPRGWFEPWMLWLCCPASLLGLVGLWHFMRGPFYGLTGNSGGEAPHPDISAMKHWTEE